MSSLFSELKRRNVFRVAAAYLIIGWLLAQVVGLAADSFAAPAWVMKMFITLLAIGFIPAVLFSWAYELTPEGIKKESEVDSNHSNSTHTSKKLNIVTLVAVIFAAGMFVYQQMNPAPISVIPTQTGIQSGASDSRLRGNDGESVGNDGNGVGNDETELRDANKVDDTSIAVLPFADLSPAGDQEYFSDGIAEEILNVLVKVKTLKVASRTSSFGFKGQESLGIPKIAEKLKVRHVLEGSVRKSGKTVRVTAQLIDARTDQHLWSETYDRQLTTESLFAIQDEVAKAIVKQLDIALNAEQQPMHENQYLPNVDSYELFLKARALYRNRIELNIADAYLIQLLEQDPGYAPAWEMRAAITSLLKDYGFSQKTDDDLLKEVEDYANEALSIQPASALAIASKANMRQNLGWDNREYQDQNQILLDLKKATEFDPYLPSPINWLGMVYADLGLLDLSIQTLRDCQQRHPFFAPCTENLFDVLVSTGEYDQAWDIFLQASEQGITTGYWVNYLLLVEKNEKTSFMLILGGRDLFLGFRNIGQIYEAFQNINADHSDLLKNVLAFANNKKSFNWTYITGLLIPLGAHDLIPFGPVMWGADHKKYRQSPEFKNHMKATGIFKYWQQQGFPPQCRAVGEEDFACE